MVEWELQVWLQVVEHLPSQHKAPIIKQKTKKKKKKKVKWT
jgi:predicted small metal-binding protein